MVSCNVASDAILSTTISIFGFEKLRIFSNSVPTLGGGVCFKSKTGGVKRWVRRQHGLAPISLE